MSIIGTYQVRGVVVIEVSGRLSILDRQVRDAVRDFLMRGYRQFILKMSDVSYIDSCGLGELVCIYTSVRNSDGNVRILAPSQRVRQLLNTTMLDTVFEILEDVAPFTNPDVSARGTAARSAEKANDPVRG
jgi:anti-sigma B factor antagonist